MEVAFEEDRIVIKDQNCHTYLDTNDAMPSNYKNVKKSLILFCFMLAENRYTLSRMTAEGGIHTQEEIKILKGIFRSTIKEQNAE